jgi:uroporphyrinogen-III decarboxylase
VAEWYISTVARQEYVYEVFQRQCEIGLANLQRIYEAVGDRVSVIFVTGTDFGTQKGPFISKQSYRELYMPFHKRVNDWVHANTGWKTFIHSCGSVVALLPDFVEAGFDILNPVQCSAAGMDPRTLKEQFGNELVFWGGGVDTQRTLPFGSPEEVRREVRERIEIFGRAGGFVFNTIHNIQARVPPENLVALFDAVQAYRDYPL